MKSIKRLRNIVIIVINIFEHRHNITRTPVMPLD